MIQMSKLLQVEKEMSFPTKKDLSTKPLYVPHQPSIVLKFHHLEELLKENPRKTAIYFFSLVNVAQTPANLEVAETS